MKLTELGKRLRLVRLDADIRLKDMAAALGTSSAYLSAVEYGRKPPTQKLVEAFIERRWIDSDFGERVLQESRCPTCGRRRRA